PAGKPARADRAASRPAEGRQRLRPDRPALVSNGSLFGREQFDFVDVHAARGLRGAPDAAGALLIHSVTKRNGVVEEPSLICVCRLLAVVGPLRAAHAGLLIELGSEELLAP